MEQSTLQVERTENDILVVMFATNKILDISNVEQVKRELLALVRNDERTDMVLDFTGVEFLSSAALGLFVRLGNQIKQHDGHVRLCNVGTMIRNVFHVSAMDTLFEIHADRESALKAFQ